MYAVLELFGWTAKPMVLQSPTLIPNSSHAQAPQMAITDAARPAQLALTDAHQPRSRSRSPAGAVGRKADYVTNLPANYSESTLWSLALVRRGG